MRDSYFKEQEDEEEDDDFYSPTSWERESGESDEDYEDRKQDLEDYLDSLNN
ncbi:MAG: hypothetical protein J6S94_00540 [Bacteroidaceae bacterium]|nr:hypothetical protein [Bacteroidaceae bacterium]